MDRYLAQLEICKQIIDRIRHMINMQRIQSNNISCTELYNELYKLIPLVPVEYKVVQLLQNTLNGHIAQK